MHWSHFGNDGGPEAAWVGISSPESTVGLRLDEPLGEIPVYLPEGAEISVADGAT
jgi:hypothetical protein